MNDENYKKLRSALELEWPEFKEWFDFNFIEKEKIKELKAK